MMEMNIPLQQASPRSQQREAEAMVAAAGSRAEGIAQQLLGELAVNLAGLDAARRTEALVKTQWLPQSELAHAMQTVTVAMQIGPSSGRGPAAVSQHARAGG